MLLVQGVWKLAATAAVEKGSRSKGIAGRNVLLVQGVWKLAAAAAVE